MPVATLETRPPRQLQQALTCSVGGAASFQKVDSVLVTKQLEQVVDPDETISVQVGMTGRGKIRASRPGVQQRQEVRDVNGTVLVEISQPLKLLDGIAGYQDGAREPNRNRLRIDVTIVATMRFHGNPVKTSVEMRREIDDQFGTGPSPQDIGLSITVRLGQVMPANHAQRRHGHPPVQMNQVRVNGS